MLRGLDSQGTDEDPIVVKVADRSRLDGTLSAYLRTGVSTVERERQARVRDTVKQVEAGGIAPATDVVDCPERARDPSGTDVEADAVALFDEFVEAVGPEPLRPFFEIRPGVGAAERVVDLPAICVAYRIDGDLAGLYPRWREGDHESIEDCLRALCSGDRLANVPRP